MQTARKSNRNFYFSAKTQFSNAGDALINRSLVRLMRNSGTIRALRGGASESFLREIGLRDQDLLSGGLIRLAKAMICDVLKRREVFVVLTPGDMVGGRANVRMLARTLAAAFLSLIGVKIIQVGASIGRFGAWERRLFALQSRFMHAVGLRDPFSIADARNAKLRNIVPFPDLAFLLTRQEGNRTASTRRVSLSFRSDRFTPEEEMTLIRRLHAGLSSLPGPIEVVIVSQVQRDEGFANRLVVELAEWSPELFISQSLDHLSLFYCDVDFMLSNRLHALLLAGLSGALPIAVVENMRDKKVVGLFTGIGLQDLVAVQEELGPLLTRVASQSSALRKKFHAVASVQREELNLAFDQIVGPR